MKRLALIGASLVLVGGMTSACGGSPDDASKKDFCAAIIGLSEVGTDKGKFEDAVDKLDDTGTPKEIKGDARKGFEVFIDALKDVDTDKLDNMEDQDPDLKGDDKKHFEKFSEEMTKVCMGDFQGQMEDQLDDLESEVTK